LFFFFDSRLFAVRGVLVGGAAADPGDAKTSGGREPDVGLRGGVDERAPGGYGVGVGGGRAGVGAAPVGRGGGRAGARRVRPAAGRVGAGPEAAVPGAGARRGAAAAGEGRRARRRAPPGRGARGAAAADGRRGRGVVQPGTHQRGRRHGAPLRARHAAPPRCGRRCCPGGAAARPGGLGSVLFLRHGRASRRKNKCTASSGWRSAASRPARSFPMRGCRHHHLDRHLLRSLALLLPVCTWPSMRERLLCASPRTELRTRPKNRTKTGDV
ncbi:hypothetical protein BAE44_0005039, partial [Dichanthelium oligosanthes]